MRSGSPVLGDGAAGSLVLGVDVIQVSIRATTVDIR
jgi:hypothetical protein